MPIVQLKRDNPFVDGRQSLRAMRIRSGVERHFAEHGCATLPEVTLGTGRRADIVAICPKGGVTIVEIKSSLADLRADDKWPEYRPDCDRLFFATLADVPADAFPAEAGLLVCDEWGAAVIRDADEHRMQAPRRRAVMLRFARASAYRLARCCAHAGVDATDFEDAG